MQEKASPVRQRSEKPQQYLQVKGESDDQLAVVKKGFLPAAHPHRSRSLEYGGSEGEEDPAPFCVLNDRVGPVMPRNDTSCLGVLFILFIRYARCKPKKTTTLAHPREKTLITTHGAAPKALLFVTVLIDENVLVITATKRFNSQKFKTTMHMIKKMHETKYSASSV